MVIRIPGIQAQEQQGPHIGPDPAWARFTRTAAPGRASSVSLQSFKPDITGYRVLGRERQSAPVESGDAERNRHNSSVYVTHASRYGGKRATDLSRLPVIGEIAAGQGLIVDARAYFNLLGDRRRS